MPREGVRRRHAGWPALLHAAEALLVLLVIGVPLAMGGVHPAVLAAVGALGGLALALVMLGRKGEGTPAPVAAVALIAGVFFAALTTVPLPAWLVGLLSPHARMLAAFPPAPEPRWQRISLDLSATLVDLPRLAGLAAIMLAAAAISRRVEGARRLCVGIALAALAVVLVAAVHAAAGISELYGFYPHQFGDEIVTPFINGNHCASLALLGALTGIGLARTTTDMVPRILWWLGAVACSVLTIETHSNAGIGALGIALILFIVLWSQRAASGVGLFVAGGVVLGIGAVAAAVIGLGGDELLSALAAAGEGKVRPWPATLQLIRESWLTGVGRGAFGAAFPPYAPPHTVATITHPENIVLHWFAEWGVPLAVGGFVALGATLWRAYRKGKDTDDPMGPLHDALLAGVVGIVLHELADFGLEFAGVGVPFSVAVGVLAGRSASQVRWRRMPWLVAATAAATAVLSLVIGRPHLADTELLALKTRVKALDAEGIDREYRALISRHPADPQVVIDGGDALLARFAEPSLPKEERLAAMERALRYLVRAQSLSQQEQPHLSLAWALARLGRRSQAFTELRLAYVSGGSLKAIDQALSYGATPEELASFPQALLHATSTGEVKHVDPAEAASVMLGYIAMERGRPGLADSTAQVLLHDASGVAHSPRLLETVCRVAQRDGECARDGSPACAPKRDAPVAFAQVVEAGREWVGRAPDDARGYACLADGYILMGADEQAQRTLNLAIERFPEALSLRASLAQWHLQQHHPEQALTALGPISGDGADPALASTIRTLRVHALWDAGRRLSARAEAEAATRMYPSEYWAYRLAASIHEANAQPDAALDDLSTAERFASDQQKPELVSWRERLLAAKAARASAPAAQLTP